MIGAFPATYSTLSASALAEVILPHYGLGDLVWCRLHATGMNDTYQVLTTTGITYYLRVYRTPWRSLTAIRYELDALCHLHRKEIPVARPLRRRDGELVTPIDAPEGRRYAALFVEACGSEPSYKDDPAGMAGRYGKSVAQMHNALDDFSSPHRRFHLDLAHLLEEPLTQVEPFLAHQPADWAWLQGTVTSLQAEIEALPASALEQGFCHGDLQGFHARVAGDGTLTHFDFDCCGYGFRAYDLAVFRWSALLDEQEDAWWQPYLAAYQDVRSLAALDVAAIPLFVCARVVWHMGLHAQNAGDWGAGHLNEAYYDRQLGRLRKALALKEARASESASSS